MNGADSKPLPAEFGAAFLPNRLLSARALQILIAAQVAIALLIWWRSRSPSRTLPFCP